MTRFHEPGTNLSELNLGLIYNCPVDMEDLIIDFLRWIEFHQDLSLWALDESGNVTMEGRNPIEPRIWAYIQFVKDRNES